MIDTDKKFGVKCFTIDCFDMMVSNHFALSEPYLILYIDQGV